MDENLPVNKRPDFLEHVDKVKDCYDYLVGQLGFQEKMNEWCSYEFTTVFAKDNTEVKITFETSLPSSIRLVNTDLPYDESKGLTNVEYISSFTPATFEIVKTRLNEKEINKQRHANKS